MSLRLRTPILAVVLFLLGFLPLLAQTAPAPVSQTAPASAPTAPAPLVFVPSQQAKIPAGTLTFQLDPSITGLPRQITTLSSQIASLQNQNAALAALAAAGAPTIYGAAFTNRYSDTSASGPHLVWLHEVMSLGEWGKTTNMDPYDGSTSVSVAQATQQIMEAMSCGVDGDAMDLQGADHTFTSAVDNTLTAADNYNAINKGASNGKGVTDFHPFLQFDFSTYPQDTATIVAEIDRCLQHPSYAKHLGLPIVSTYAGEGGTYAQVQARFQAVEAALLAQSPPVRIWFQPFFNLRDPNGSGPVEGPVFAAAQEAAFLKPFAQGAWLFGTGFAPPTSASSQLPAAEIYASALRAQGLAWWGSVTTGHHGVGHTAPGRYYDEPYGFEGLDHQMSSILASQQAQDIEIVTGNDRGEGTALTNAPAGPGSPWNYYPNSNLVDFWKSTSGMQAEMLYHVQQYKTGVIPSVATDNLWVSYCTQPHSASAPDPAGAMGPVGTEDGAALPPDTIFVDTDTTQAALLTVTDGPTVWTRMVAPGFAHNRFGPYVPGAVSFKLANVNTNQTLLTLTGEPVLTQAQVTAFGVYDWVPYTADAHD